MSGLITAISTGVTAFSATNVDDIVLLTLFFSQVNAKFRRLHIVAGQYIGFTTLVLASLPGFFSGLIVPQPIVGLFGFIPIAIGISRLLHRKEESEEVAGVTDQTEHPLLAGFLSPQTYSVAAITVANGTDNISIYVPLFASSNYGSLLVILSVFFLSVGILCYSAYKLTHQREIADVISRYGNNLVPFALIGLGTFIIIESDVLTLLNLFPGASLMRSLSL